MSLYEQIDLAKKFGDGKVAISESIASTEPDKTANSLAVAKRLSESCHKEEKTFPPLGAMPVPN